jgi:RNA binding exosome subunit
VLTDFSSGTVSFFVHATEDCSRLLARVQNRFSISPEEIESRDLVGHYGNRVTSITVHLAGARANELAYNLFAGLDKQSAATFSMEIDKSVDEHGALFIRVDRQSLAAGSLFLGEQEPIRIKLKPKLKAPRAEMLDAYRNLLRGPR